MTLTVHHLQVSQSERILWLVEELDLEYDLKLHQRDPFLSPQSIKDLNVLGQAPVIQDGSTTVAESGACADYILQKYGNGNLRLSPDHKNFADYVHWFHFANGNLQPQFARLMTLKFANVDLDNNPQAQRHVGQLNKFLKYVDDRVKDNEWLAGSEFTAADCMNVFTLTTMRTFYPLDISEYQNIVRYLHRVSERPGYKRARAKGDPELPLMIDGKIPEQFMDVQKAKGKI